MTARKKTGTGKQDGRAQGKRGGGAAGKRAKGRAGNGTAQRAKGRRTIPMASAVPALSPPARRYLKSKPLCKVTFRLPAEAAAGAGSVALVGDFNNWDPAAAMMKRLKDGTSTLVLDLEPGREYRFRYLIDGRSWENDWCADRYDPNPFGGEDSIIVL